MTSSPPGSKRMGSKMEIDGDSPTKFDVARDQLICALDLYLKDMHPFSIHSLAGNAREILEALCITSAKSPFLEHALKTLPKKSERDIWNAINFYRNAFKHADRNDDEQLERFDDAANEHMLFVAIYDYHAYSGRLTIPMQIFQAWYYTAHIDRLAPHAQARYGHTFDALKGLSRSERKAALCQSIAKACGDSFVQSHPMTEIT